MKKPNMVILLLCLAATVLITGSCSRDGSCPAINCNTGTLNDETCECDCPSGFTGDNCEDEDLCITQNVVCENGGTCLDGLCDCPVGYTGDNCENFDPLQVQSLLDAGRTPIELYNGGISLEGLYGKMYQGGLIFYLNIADGTGLVAAANDQSTAANWGCFGTDIAVLNNVITCVEDCMQPEPEETDIGARLGDGPANTDAILGECSNNGIAAKLCRDLGAEWFLPSRGELNLMYVNLHANGHGGFASDLYWNSTECDFVISWFNNFSNGLLDYGNKSDDIYVRAALAF